MWRPPGSPPVARRGRGRRWLCQHRRRRRRLRHDDLEHRATPRTIRHGHVARQAAHDVAADEQAKPRADADLLRREEGLEDALAILDRHSGPGVRDLDERFRAVAAGADDDLVFRGAVDGERLHRVHHQVQHHLDQPPFVAADGRRLAQVEDHARARFDLLGDELQHGQDHPAQVDGLEAALSRAAEGPQVAGDGADACGARADGRESLAHALQGRLRVMQRRALEPADELLEHVQLPLHILAVREDVRERVVDLVCHARRQRPERHHPIVLHHRPLQVVKLADVVRQARQAGHLARGTAQRRQPGVVDGLADLDGVPERLAGEAAADVSGDRRVRAVDVQQLLADELARFHAEGPQPRALRHRDHARRVGRPDARSGA